MLNVIPHPNGGVQIFNKEINTTMSRRVILFIDTILSSFLFGLTPSKASDISSISYNGREIDCSVVIRKGRIGEELGFKTRDEWESIPWNMTIHLPYSPITITLKQAQDIVSLSNAIVENDGGYTFEEKLIACQTDTMVLRGYELL